MQKEQPCEETEDDGVNKRSRLELVANFSEKYRYKKTLGTSGINGALYETKLLSLILFRALYDEDIKEFILGTNIEGIGALDDVILRYNTKNSQKTKMLILQAKHRENEKITVDDLLNPKRYTNLHTYFESYLRIRQKFITDKDDPMFQGTINNIDCNFVLYTSAKRYNSMNQTTVRNITLEEIHEGENLIKTSKDGKVLQVQYENEFDDLISTVSKTRATALAQSLIYFIINRNSLYERMMLDNIIKEYRIYLTQNIIDIEVGTSNETASHSSKVTDHLVGRFYSSFLTSDDEYLQFIKSEIHKELAKIKGLSPNSDQDELNEIMKSFTFKLPTDFGKTHYSFGGHKTKQQRKLTRLCSIFEKIFQSSSVADSTYIYIHLDDDSVGPDGIVQFKDLGNDWLGGLVGNLLINDDETEMLKFNLNETDLSEDNIKILQQLKKNRDITQLSMFRFNINFLNFNFPKLTLNCREYYRKLLKHFLDNLRIYTNQAKEDEVENVLKNELYTFYKNRKNLDFMSHIKCDAIFLTFHDKIQKWWKQSISAPYLTEKWNFFQEIQAAILDSPRLNLVHFVCCENIHNSLVEFEKEAINSLKLYDFFNSKETITMIISDEIHFSSVKVVKYLNEFQKQIDYKFLNLDSEIVQSSYDKIINELEISIPVSSTLVVVCQGNTDVDYKRLLDILDIFKGKIIIVTDNSHKDKLVIKYPGQLVHRDTTNKFNNLAHSVRKIIREEREIIFQGFSVIVNRVLGDDALDLFSPALLRKIINKDKIVITVT